MSGNISIIIKKELRSYFTSPIAYVVIALMGFVSSLIFFTVFNFFEFNSIYAFDRYFTSISFTMFILIAAITMRSWSEERNQKTDEILTTLPFSEVKLVLGKFLASFILFLIMLAVTIFVPIMVSPFGDFDGGQIFVQYLGIIFLGAASIALGQLVSSLSINQIISFLVTMFVLFLMIMLGQLSLFLGSSGFFDIVKMVTFSGPFSSFNMGIIDFKSIVLFCSYIFIFLYFNVKVLKFRKWK
ncbi:MAG: ABC transporter permease subunit [Spirochaetales bacterium]|nr:ABC transporter permease subunit [Spirochaetales bacterium]